MCKAQYLFIILSCRCEWCLESTDLFLCLCWPGSPAAAPSRLEVTALADCVPFLGVEDLREILAAVLRRHAATVRDSRPLKVRNYLQVRRKKKLF